MVIAVLAFLFLLPAPIGIAVIALAAAAEVAEFFFWQRFLRRYRIRTGVEAMVGTSALVTQPCEPDGVVRWRGELWRARCDTPLRPGESATVRAVDGLTLILDPDSTVPLLDSAPARPG